MRDTNYATEKATAIDSNGQCIERIFVKEYQQDEIRFSWWKDGHMMMRPLDLSESDLLTLFHKAIMGGVFSETFLADLHGLIYDTRREARYAGES